MGIIELIAIIFLVPSVAIVGAVGTDQQKELCENVLHGHYAPAPQGTDVCPDGKWLYLFQDIKEKLPQPK